MKEGATKVKTGINGWPLWSNLDGIKSMDTNHIENTIAWIERKWKQLPDYDDHLVADHWSLSQVVFIPGKTWYRGRLIELQKELSRRKAALK